MSSITYCIFIYSERSVTDDANSQFEKTKKLLVDAKVNVLYKPWISGESFTDILVENKEIKMENEQIKMENKDIKMENKEIKMENEQIKMVNEQIKRDIQEIKDILNTQHKENKS